MRRIILALSLGLVLSACQRLGKSSGTGEFDTNSSPSNVSNEALFGRHASEPKTAIQLTPASTGSRAALAGSNSTCNSYYGCQDNSITQFINLSNWLFGYHPEVSTLAWMYFTNVKYYQLATVANSSPTPNYFPPPSGGYIPAQGASCLDWHIVLTENSTGKHSLARLRLSSPSYGGYSNWVRSGPNNNILTLDFRLQDRAGKAPSQAEFLFAIAPVNGTENALSMDVTVTDCWSRAESKVPTQSLSPCVRVGNTTTGDVASCGIPGYDPSSYYIKYSSTTIPGIQSSSGGIYYNPTIEGRYMNNSGYNYYQPYLWSPFGR